MLFRSALVILLVSTFFSFPGTALSRETGNPPLSPEDLPIQSLPPDFTLLDAQGNNIYPPASRTEARPAILWFWSIYDHSCEEGILSLRAFQERFGEENLKVLAINEDTQTDINRIRRFLERFENFRGKITYPVLFDQKGEISANLGLPGPSAVLLVDEVGKIRAFYPGFDLAAEADLTAALEQMFPGVDPKGEGDFFPPGRQEFITVTGTAPLCGFFESGIWRKGFTGNNDVFLELEKTRDLAEREAFRNTVLASLEMLGLSLLSRNREDICIDDRGIHLARDPLKTPDPIGNLIARISYPDYFRTVREEEQIFGNTVFINRTVRVFLDSFADFLQSLGYTRTPESIRLIYPNPDPMNQRDFISVLTGQSMFVARLEDLGPSSPQTIEVFTTPGNLAEEIASMDFGDLNVFVENITPTSMDIEIWK